MMNDCRYGSVGVSSFLSPTATVVHYKQVFWRDGSTVPDAAEVNFVVSFEQALIHTEIVGKLINRIRLLANFVLAVML